LYFNMSKYYDFKERYDIVSRIESQIQVIDDIIRIYEMDGIKNKSLSDVKEFLYDRLHVFHKDIESELNKINY